MKILITLLCFNFIIIGCNKSKAPLLQAPPETFQELNIAAGQTQAVKPPRVQVLFVVDNSGSMLGHQNTVNQSTAAFVDAVLSNPRIEAQFAVVPVYDRRFKDGETGVCRDPSTPRQMNKLGELVSLKDENNNVIDGAAPYVTRDTPNAVEVLKSTLRLGVQCGPEAEESFSPVLAVIENQDLNNGVNAGFYNEDDYLVVIFITDADDVTPGLTATQFYDRLVAAKGGNREKVLIATALANPAKKSDSCKIDGNGPISKFPELISISRAFYADLCSGNFGKAFAEFGQSVADRIALQRIRLNFLPEVGYEITYGHPSDPEDQRQVINGAVFLEETNEFLLPANLPITRIEGGEIFIKATPVQLRNHSNGRLNTL